MKQNKLIKNKIVFNVFLSLCIIWAFVFYVIPQIIDISNKKSELNQTISNIDRIKSKWLNFEEYLDVVSSWYKDILNRQEFSDSTRQKFEETFLDGYLSFVLENNPKQLYIRNLSNTTPDNYETFLSKKELEIESKSKSNFIEWREKKVSNILPNYVQSWDANFSDENSNNYDDFKYINYIERLLYTYDLKNNSAISIWEIFSVDSVKAWEKIPEWGINYFDISLDLVWKKKDVLDFILFLENVWKIEIDGDNVKVVRNPLFNWEILSWDVSSRVYNMLENPIAEIVDISFDDYVDSSLSTSWWNLSLYELVSKTQSREQFDAKIKIRIYAKWEPNSKKREFSKDVLSSYWVLLQKTNSLIKRLGAKRDREITNKNILLDISKAENIRDYLTALNLEIQQIRPLLWRPDAIDSLYSKAKTINKSFTQIEKFLSSFDESSKN